MTCTSLRNVLAQGVSDATGREDLLRHLRTHALLAAARRLGCGKLARGDCATRLAAHVVAAAAKGCGYGLPGDVHLVDARWEGLVRRKAGAEESGCGEEKEGGLPSRPPSPPLGQGQATHSIGAINTALLWAKHARLLLALGCTPGRCDPGG